MDKFKTAVSSDRVTDCTRRGDKDHCFGYNLVMSNLYWFAVDGDGVKPLSVPVGKDSFDRLYADLPAGVYSTLCTFEHNQFLGLADHLARTRHSIALLKWSFELDERALCRALHEVCTNFPFPEARVRFDILAEPVPAIGSDSRVLIALVPLQPWPAHLYEEGATVGIAHGLVRTQPLAKTADFAQKRLAYQQADDNDQLLVGVAGHLLEGTGSNFYGVRDGVVWTAGEGVLSGVTRKVILSLLPEIGIPYTLEPVHVQEIATLDEAALSSASRGFMPVVRIAGQVIGNGRPGPVTQRIQVAYNRYLATHIKTAI